jgi:hypothetical protein
MPLATHSTVPSLFPSRHTSKALFAALQRIVPLSFSDPSASMQRSAWSGAHARPYDTKSPSHRHSGEKSGGPAKHVPWPLHETPSHALPAAGTQPERDS